jgi:hypothetical protein
MAVQEPSDVDAVAVELAVQMVKSLEGKQELSDQELEAFRAGFSPTDQLVGYSAMINALARLIDQHPEQFTIQGDEGFTKLVTSRDLIPIAVSSLSQGKVGRRHLPTVAGALTAASSGITPSDWRRGLGPIDIQELPAWAWLAWFLSKFIDAARQEDGLALTVVQEALDMAAGDDELEVGGAADDQ